MIFVIMALSASLLLVRPDQYARIASLDGMCVTYSASHDWWSYELCFGRENGRLVQYREGLDVKHTMHAGGGWSAPAGEAFARQSPFIQTFMNGTRCSSGHSNRTAAIFLQCCAHRPAAAGQAAPHIVGVHEDRPCEYRVDVCTALACGAQRKGKRSRKPTRSPRFPPHRRFLFPRPAMSAQTVRRARAKATEMFYWAWEHYTRAGGEKGGGVDALPAGELRPMSCSAGCVSATCIPLVTLVDALDTLALLRNASEFRRGVALVAARGNFDQDVSVSVFETTIRVLGGLLAADELAADETLALYAGAAAPYDGALLALARDLGDRLLAAFETRTGAPFGTVNLRRGVPPNETPLASTAGVGSLTLEFAHLSARTGDPRYGAAAARASRVLWRARSALDLVGKHLDVTARESEGGSARWTDGESGVGHNTDSYFEYMWKWYVLSGDTSTLWRFAVLHRAIERQSRVGDWYADVHLDTGRPLRYNSDALAAFWPGVLAQMGELADATRALNAFYAVWREHRMMPEQFDYRRWIAVVAGNGRASPLRPELIESTLHVYRATGDDSWRWAALDVLHSLDRWTRTKCGFASIKNVVTKEQEDLMPSYFLSETLKYLLLLFDADDAAADDRGDRGAREARGREARGGGERAPPMASFQTRRGRDHVLTTEAHPLPLLRWGAYGNEAERAAGEERAAARVAQVPPHLRRVPRRAEAWLTRRQCRKQWWWEAPANSYDAVFNPRFTAK
jgi:mannosidase alpha-like ER degradation enhancer 2